MFSNPKAYKENSNKKLLDRAVYGLVIYSLRKNRKFFIGKNSKKVQRELGGVGTLSSAGHPGPSALQSSKVQELQSITNAIGYKNNTMTTYYDTHCHRHKI